MLQSWNSEMMKGELSSKYHVRVHKMLIGQLDRGVNLWRA